MKRLVPVFLFLLLVLGLGCGRREHLPTAQRGVLDLSGYDLDHREPIGLDGEWSFYWRQLLAPGEFSGPRAPAPAGYLLVPGDWNGFRSQGRAIGGLGYATLHLKVLLGPGQVPLALRLFGIHSAYRLWVDGRLAAESGRLGHREDGEAADPSVRIVAITRDGPALDLVLQVSNFHDRNGGLPVSVQFGRQAAVQGAQNRNWALAMLFVGSLLVMGFYHLAIYGFRKANRSPLYFGIYCLLWIGCAMGDEFSDYVIRLFLPGLPPAVFGHASLCSFFISVPVGIQFFRSLFPQEFPVRVLRLSQAIALPFVLVTLGPWTLLLSWAVPVYFQISIVLILYCQVRLLQAWRRGRDGAAYILSGFLFLGFLGINDMLQEMRLIHTATIIAVGLLGFVLAQALALSRRFSRAFSAVEDLTIDLSHQNIALEEEVAERRRLEKEIVQVSEEERRRVSHDLHDGLCQLLTGARLRCSVLIRKHAKDAEGAPELAQLSALLEESVDQAYNLSRGLWPKEHEPKDVCTSLEGLACRSAQSAGITVDFCQQGTCAVCTNVHVTQLYHIAEEAIANALKHARATRIRVSLDCLPRHTVTLTVQDDGIGRAAAKPTKGGMGLRIMAHRARMLGGEFRLENAEGRGTLVICSVPCEGRPEETP